MLHRPNLKIIPIIHRNQNVVILEFNCDDNLISVAKSIGCRWSSTHQSWYVYNSNENLRLIGNVVSELANIEYNGDNPKTEKVVIN